MPEEPDGDDEAAPDPEPVRRRRRPRILPALPDGEEPAPRHVSRSRSDRVAGGVCGGIARAYGVDPSFVRALAVVGCFAGGASVVAYLLALFLIPLERIELSRRTPPARPHPDPALAWLGAALVAGSAFAFSRFELFHFRLLTLDRGAIWPLLLAGLAILIVRSRRNDPDHAHALAHRQMARPRRDRLVFGVASGFARYAAVDPNLVRLALVVIAVWSYGICACLYLALAAFIPEDLPPADA